MYYLNIIGITDGIKHLVPSFGEITLKTRRYLPCLSFNDSLKLFIAATMQMKLKRGSLDLFSNSNFSLNAIKFLTLEIACRKRSNCQYTKVQEIDKVDVAKQPPVSNSI